MLYLSELLLFTLRVSTFSQRQALPKKKHRTPPLEALPKEHRTKMFFLVDQGEDGATGGAAAEQDQHHGRGAGIRAQQERGSEAGGMRHGRGGRGVGGPLLWFDSGQKVFCDLGQLGQNVW